MRLILWVFVIVCLVCFGEAKTKSRQDDDRGPRPQLIGNRVVPLSNTLTSELQEYLWTTLEFDQDVYVNDAFVCPGSEDDCIPKDCDACDWSIENPTDCDNPRCCGPAQWPQFPSVNHTDEWCDSSLPPYTKLDFNVRSEEFTIGKDELKYFRFFIGEEHYCRTIQVEVTTSIGDMAITISKFLAYPSNENLKKIENGQQFDASSMTRNDPADNFGQSVMFVCPNVNPAYERGTYSIALTGFHELNNASVIVHLGEDRYPIAPPEDRILCEDVPDDIYRAPYLDPYPWAGNVCLEEGVTQDLTILIQRQAQREWYDVVLPVRPGCREISFIYDGHTNTKTDPNAFPDSNFYFFCGVSGDGGNELTAIIAKLFFGSTFYVSACFEEITYLHCSILNVFASGTGKFYWSSEATPLRHKISEADPAMLTTYYGRFSAGALERSLTYEGTLEWNDKGWSWLTQPSEDPLVFYPPDGSSGYAYTENPLDVYNRQFNLSEPKSNFVGFVDLTYRGQVELRNRETLLEEGFIYSLKLTSATGMPVDLCSDRDLEMGNCDRGAPLADENSWTDFMPTRTFSSMNVVTDLGCDGDDYQKQTALVEQTVQVGLESSNIDDIAMQTYLVDIYNAALTRTSCLIVMEKTLSTELENITRVDKVCPFEHGTQEWTYDPCCNPRATSAYCCAPTVVSVEADLYVDSDIESNDELSCKNPDCDESFFNDIATSLNSVGNALIGCDSGVQNPNFQLQVLYEEALADFVRPCLLSSGFGDTFTGVECSCDEDCDLVGSSCNREKGICRLETTQETRDKYFDCFYENMPPLVEDYIRNTVLSPLDDFPKNTKFFRQAVYEAATKYDCLSLDPLDLTQGERWSANAALYCKGDGLGFESFAEMEANIDVINELCPEYLCLGQGACRFENAKRCEASDENAGDCIVKSHQLFPASESSCPVDESICSITSTLSSPACDEGDFHCVSCSSASEPCVVVEGVDTEEQCAELVACEVPGGGVRYDLTEEECLNFGECSSLCDGESCRSVDDKKGVCVVEGIADCPAIGGVEFDGECILEQIGTTYACDQASTELSATTEWYMCETMDIAECSNASTFAAPYKHLRCFVDIFRTCENEAECLAVGTCSDVEVAKNVIPDGAGWFSVSYGTCLSSGNIFSVDEDKREPRCLVPIGEEYFKFGCYFPGVPERTCSFLGSPFSFLPPIFTAWVVPARTQETCQQNAFGRFGCALPSDYQKSFWFWSQEDCECEQGLGQYLYTWSPGEWERGIPRSLQWKQAELLPKYSWGEALSLVEMESWVRSAVETFFSYNFKSQLVCEGNYLTSSLSTLVCDCVDGRSECYDSELATQVGIVLACRNRTSILKGPSSFTTFSETSVDELCTEATLSLVQQSWFLFPRSPPSVSFEFAERQEKGVVLNSKGAEVGEVMGDGSQIIFEKPDLVRHFYSCLLVSEDADDFSDEYPKRDFGYLKNGSSTIRPFGLSNVEERREEQFLYWCANLTRGLQAEEGTTLFPLLTIQDPESKDNDFLSHQTESLLYTLAACYIFVLIIDLLFIFVMIHKHTLSGNTLPYITYLGVILAIVCVFRIVFCFVYIDDGFSELSEYVVFEIPTFLLFTAVILVIVLFMQLSQKNTFDFKGQNNSILAFGLFVLFLVWTLFIVVTIVYAEVILEEDNEAVCRGRIQADNDQVQEDTRTLSIVYQTIVIFLTLIFALVFARQARHLLKLSKNSSTKAKVFIFRLGAIMVISFLLRCVLFIILLAVEFTSDIYLFITLFLTEVVMILLISLELNKGFYTSMAGVFVLSFKTTSGAKSRSGDGSFTSSRPPAGSMQVDD